MASSDQRVIQDLVRPLLQTNQRELDYSDLAAELIDAFGGNKQFAKVIHQQFLNAPDGGMVKAQILKYTLSVLEKHAALVKDRPPIESMMSEEELLEEVRLFMSELESQRRPDFAEPPPATSEGSPDIGQQS